MVSIAIILSRSRTTISVCISITPWSMHCRRVDRNFRRVRQRKEVCFAMNHRLDFLKKWLREHRVHPYPSNQEKLELAKQSSITYDQVTTWFNNARAILRRQQAKLRRSLDKSRADELENHDDDDEDADGNNHPLMNENHKRADSNQKLSTRGTPIELVFSEESSKFLLSFSTLTFIQWCLLPVHRCPMQSIYSQSDDIDVERSASDDRRRNPSWSNDANSHTLCWRPSKSLAETNG